MSNSSWVEDATSEAEEEQEDSEFESQIRTIINTDGATIAESLLEDGLSDVNNVDLLKQMRDHVDGQESKEELVEERLRELRADTEETEASGDDEEEVGEADESDVSDESSSSSGFAQSGGESESDDAESESESEDDGIPATFEEFDNTVREAIMNGSLGSVPVEAFEEYAEELPEKSPEVVERTKEVASRDAVLDALPDMSEAESETDEAPEKSEETTKSSSSGFASSDSDGASESVEDELGADTPTVDPDAVEPPEPGDMEEPDAESIEAIMDSVGGMSAQEAAEKEDDWTVLVWGKEGKGKTHFAFTAQDPIFYIDTENKAEKVAEKFQDKRIQILQPGNYDEARDAVERSLAALEKIWEQEGVLGTLVVDSMSIMWEWSQQKYVDKYYPNKDVSEVDFETAFGGGQSDWKKIKDYHNAKFRDKIVNSPFNFVWTAMAKEDYEATLEENLNWTPQKPDGEKNNTYKASEVIYLREDDAGRTIGELQKSDRVKHKYVGLEEPTLEKHKQVVEAIKEAEMGNRSIESVEAEFDVELIEGNPRTARISGVMDNDE